MRLIDADAVLRDLDTLWDYATVDGITASTVLAQVKTDVRNVPAVDAVPVVRCGECKHMTPNGRCREFADESIRPSASDYCSKGKRKDGKDDLKE